MSNGDSSRQPCLFTRLGVTDYPEAWKLQQSIASQRWEGLLPDTLMLLEHPHTYTLGRRGRREDVLLEEEGLGRLGVALYHVDRGGEATYHGPGQLVGYPIVDVRPLGGPVKYVRALEAVMIDVLEEFSIQAHREDGFPGVWVGQEKIGAIGVKISRGIATHGFALNVNPDLSYFQHIVPCGIRDMGVTSMQCLLVKPVVLEEVALRVVYYFGRRFGRDMVEMELGGLPASEVGEQIRL
ncbi:MAG: lipoyl(octanoyl) transferase LipB [Chloroflexi bacterium]|nr:lipoyl(octanoyl) transferase LipB [Chloroflexota bacterium]